MTYKEAYEIAKEWKACDEKWEAGECSLKDCDTCGLKKFKTEQYVEHHDVKFKALETMAAMESDYLTVSKEKTQKAYDYYVGICAGCENPRCNECYMYQVIDALRFALKYGFKEGAK